MQEGQELKSSAKRSRIKEQRNVKRSRVKKQCNAKRSKAEKQHKNIKSIITM
jgi:hypothetical protein